MTAAQQVNQFAQFLTDIMKKLSPGQLRFAKKMLEDIADTIYRLENKSIKLEKEITGIKHDNYPSVLLKFVDVAQILGIDMIEFMEMDRKVIDFIMLHLEAIRKTGPVTVERFFQIARIVKFYQQVNGEYPTTMNQVKNEFNNLKNERNGEN